MMGSMQARMTSRGRVTIPAEIRRKLGIKPGTRLIVREVEGQIVVMTLEQFVRSLRGKLKGGKGMRALREERQDEAMREEKRLDRKARVL